MPIPGSGLVIDRQFIWGLRYIDDLIRRDRYVSGSINSTHFAMQDANFNVAALAQIRRSQISIATGGRGFLEENLIGSSKAEALAGAVIE